MRLRRVCTLIAFCSVLLTSGCCWDRGCCRHHQRSCGCGREASCYPPSNYGPSGYAGAPPLAAPVSSGPAIPMPTPLMPPGASH